MPSESVANEPNVAPANSTAPEEEEDMLTSFFNGIFGSDNSTEPEAAPEEEQEGITEFFTNLFSGEPENATDTSTNTT